MGLGGCEIEAGQAGGFVNLTFHLESIGLGHEITIELRNSICVEPI